MEDMVKTSHMHTVQKKRKTMQLTDIGICAGLLVLARVHMPGCACMHLCLSSMHAGMTCRCPCLPSLHHAADSVKQEARYEFVDGPGVHSPMLRPFLRAHIVLRACRVLCVREDARAYTRAWMGGRVCTEAYVCARIFMGVT